MTPDPRLSCLSRLFGLSRLFCLSGLFRLSGLSRVFDPSGLSGLFGCLASLGHATKQKR